MRAPWPLGTPTDPPTAAPGSPQLTSGIWGSLPWCVVPDGFLLMGLHECHACLQLQTLRARICKQCNGTASWTVAPATPSHHHLAWGHQPTSRLWGHRPPQAARTDVTLGDMSCTCIWAAASLPPHRKDAAQNQGREKHRLERNAAHPAARWGLVLIASPSSIQFLHPAPHCCPAGSQHAPRSLLGTVPKCHSGTWFLERATELAAKC